MGSAEGKWDLVGDSKKAIDKKRKDLESSINRQTSSALDLASAFYPALFIKGLC